MRRLLCLTVVVLLAAALPASAAGKRAEWNPNLQNVNGLLGSEVRNSQDEHLGEVQDVIIDLNKSTVAYLIIEAGGILEIDEELIVPFAAFEKIAGQNTLVLDADKESLLKAPPEDERTVMDRDRAATLHLYYGVAPYWDAHPAIMEQIEEKR